MPSAWIGARCLSVHGQIRFHLSGLSATNRRFTGGMVKLYFEAAHRVLLVRVTGIFSSQDITDVDQMVIQFLATHERAGEKSIRGIFDYSTIEALSAPASRMAERSRHPAIVQGKRVMVIRNIREPGFALAFAQQQTIAGYDEPAVVETLAEAQTLLGLEQPRFDPVDQKAE
jgi:hypothetical protein